MHTILKPFFVQGMLKIWSEIIPARKGIDFTSKSRLCRLHFTDDCFREKKGSSRWRLKKDAVPSKFPEEIPSYLIKVAKKRKAPADRENSAPIQKRAKRTPNKAPVAVSEERDGVKGPSGPSSPSISTTCSTSNICAATAEEELPDEALAPVSADGESDDDDSISAEHYSGAPPESYYDFDIFKVDVPNIQLPLGWEVKIHMNEAICFSKMVFQEGIGFSAEKTILFQRGTPTIMIIGGRPIRPLSDFGANILVTPGNLIQFIRNIDDINKYKHCQGVTNNHFAEDCSGLISAKSKRVRCHECKVKFGNLSLQECRKRMRRGVKKKPPQYRSLRQKMADLRTSVFIQ